jgi:hypothetical protein
MIAVISAGRRKNSLAPAHQVRMETFLFLLGLFLLAVRLPDRPGGPGALICPARSSSSWRR